MAVPIYPKIILYADTKKSNLTKWDMCPQNHQEKKFGPSDFEDRLEQLTSRYEERIIELHSVIAELRKKLDRHHINVIRSVLVTVSS